MELETLALQEKNEVMLSYNNDQQFLQKFFDYPYSDDSYVNRLQELEKRTIQRQQLAETIQRFMTPFGISTHAQRHIDELADNGVVVIGGQQAGVLTGPMYSVHKAITVILLARKQRIELGVPVIPVFWVAGEDHDLNEINHVYTETNGRAVKNQYYERYVMKLTASDTVYDQVQMASFVKSIFGNFGETAHTKNLLHEVLDAVEQEKTFTNFFVRLMNHLFQSEGLLLIDANFKPLRLLESNYFCRLINEAEPIATLIAKKEEQFVQEGFNAPIQSAENAAHLFYIHETGRVLLTREQGDFVNESAGIRFTREELLQIAERKPWLLSNNVATRPLMQEMVFPVLAFVGGPGEIAYWAILKDAFHHLDMKMPIIAPRISMTLVTPQVKHVLTEKSLTVEDVLLGKIKDEREKLIGELRNDQLDQLVDETEQLLIEQYEKLQQLVKQQKMLLTTELLQKNVAVHKNQLNYLRDKAEEATLLKYDPVFRTYNLLEGELNPNGSLQERIYTPYAYLNDYGPELIKDLLGLPFEMDGTHKVVYL
ncbi:bacillithiol biosynthesis cysteine-adding enzyme BshC [Sporosarcina sp. HYO08]|uniref:bacillithiol biosynthesis cysteine-adding enzyme BshC n=1 Tax=Sporosarcina sp. HYO08 TaxID=1759557 RepID=UPI0007940CC2|nr:bacillithiol biosynthesis cysteine-adding enzyme BshC [Sporosarcina sp. HYO08]KXH79891.1 hypothetical protein AU377_10460 [Sporosarcina sp. HYO08]